MDADTLKAELDALEQELDEQVAKLNEMLQTIKLKRELLRQIQDEWKAAPADQQ
ncbi:MAG TPA: hypothetical protein VFM05_06575 [Candidatus Saccharimonadales bacterium]|nr:hypothetical protein [Candidatus Saccharimonadales bacterium]